MVIKTGSGSENLTGEFGFAVAGERKVRKCRQVTSAKGAQDVILW